eukprot:TRINITY_DN6242_c0_g1_i2.p1 TRINITY_DN6242_c0_g1~~TRINITY_DN6242_c0_g1_i2.p1  ORF type:complete len:339 (+),score=72.37 TRINITY_DN6242_c0_g1_i2:90-1106(+)
MSGAGKSSGKAAVKKKPSNAFGIPAEEVEDILKKLRTRYVTGCRVADDIPPLRSLMQHIAKCIEEQELFTKLVVSEELGERGAEVLLTLLNTYPYLLTLCLWRVHCGDRGSLALANYICLNPLLSHLELMDCRVSANSCDSLGRALRLNTHVKTLLLDHNSIGDEGISLLFNNGLKYNKTITSLKLKFCGIGDVGARILAEYMVSGGILQDLDLQGNKISSRGVIILAEAMKGSSTLTTLNLAFNEFGGDQMAWIALLDGARTSASLRTLDVNRNTITDDIGNRIIQLLTDNEALKTVVVSDRLSGPIAQEIVRIVQSRNVVKKKAKAKKKSPSKSGK